MERIESLANAKVKVFRDVQATVSKVKSISEHEVKDLRDGISRLREIRSAVYEDLNQIQHEDLILRGLAWLLENGFGPEVEWAWNPRQTGTGIEPDLRGSLNGKILVSAEATTSEDPQGSIDSRMRDTLEKLCQMEGQHFYFVIADRMEKRARTRSVAER